MTYKSISNNFPNWCS